MTDIEFTDNSEEVLRILRGATMSAAEIVGGMWESNAKGLVSIPRRLAPELRNSITHARGGQPMAKASYTSDDGSKTGSYSGSMDGDKKAVYIGTNVAYAGYVHDGTSKMEPNRFLASAASGHGDDYSKIMERSLKDV